MKQILWSTLKQSLEDYPYISKLNSFFKLLKHDERVIDVYIFGSLIQNNYDYSSDVDIIIILFKSRGFKIEQEYYMSKSGSLNFLDIFPYSVGEYNKYINDNKHFLYDCEKVKVIL